MIVEAAAIVAGSVLLGLGGVMWAILRHTKSFGTYEARQGKVEMLILAVHETQQMLVKQNDAWVAEWRAAQHNGKKEVA